MKFLKEIRRQWVEEKAYQELLVAMALGIVVGLVIGWLV